MVQRADWGKQEESNLPSPTNRICDPAATTSSSHAGHEHKVAPRLPDASLAQRNNITQDDARQSIEAAGKARDGAGENQLVHGLCETAKETAKSKCGVCEQKEGFGPE